jgi:hypothetical protein
MTKPTELVSTARAIVRRLVVQLLSILALLTPGGSAQATSSPTDADGFWTRPAVARDGPSARYGQTATYDPIHERMIMVGGWGDNGGLKDTWLLPLSPLGCPYRKLHPHVVCPASPTSDLAHLSS